MSVSNKFIFQVKEKIDLLELLEKFTHKSIDNLLNNQTELVTNPLIVRLKQ